MVDMYISTQKQKQAFTSNYAASAADVIKSVQHNNNVNLHTAQNMHTITCH